MGYGAIGATVASAMSAHNHAAISHVLVRPGRETNAASVLGQHTIVVSDLVNFLQTDHNIDVVADCAGHEALKAHGPQFLASGVDVYSLSCGAMADDPTADALHNAAVRGGSQLKLLSGAIGALDALSAGAVGDLSSVRYRGRKPPKGWAGSAAENTVDLDNIKQAVAHFNGTARVASATYPKNANVAASVALAGVGLDATEVELLVDPDIDVNVHEVDAQGEFGSLKLRVEGNALKNNPRSSALAAFSMIRALKNRYSPISVGT